jgi:hypothetical protein
MKTLRQTDDGAEHAYDISLDSSGDFAFSEGKAAYANIIADTVRTLECEMQLNIDRGIPYQRTIWTSVSELNIWEIYIRDAVNALAFVSGIDDFVVNVDGSHLDYTLVVSTDAGAVEVSGGI